MTKFRHELGMRIFQAREQAGATQKEVAAAMHVSRGAVSCWENGKRAINSDVLMKLSKALGVSVGWLVGEVRG